MSDRRQARIKRRVTCEILVEGGSQRGIVRDASERGLFVQTQARLAHNQIVEVRLPAMGGGEPIHVRARVARQKRVPTQLVQVAAGGIGLEILDAPPQFQHFLDGARPALAAASPRSTPARPSESESEDGGFRVRVKQTTGSRSRCVTKQASSPAAAERAVLRELGPGWQVVETKPA